MNKFYIARDEDGTLCLYTRKPTKTQYMWTASFDNFVYINPDLFPEVKWEDEEPTEVELTIKK